MCLCFSLELHCAALSLASGLVVHLAKKTPLVRKTSGKEGGTEEKKDRAIVWEGRAVIGGLDAA